MRWISSPQKIRWKTEFANDLNLNERQDPRFLNPTPYIPPPHPSTQEKKSGVCVLGGVGGWVGQWGEGKVFPSADKEVHSTRQDDCQ